MKVNRCITKPLSNFKIMILFNKNITNVKMSVRIARMTFIAILERCIGKSIN